MFYKSSILVQKVLYFSNRLSSSMQKDINFVFLSLSPPLTLKDITYALILDNIKTSGFITSSKYPIFVLVNFKATTLSTLKKF